MTDEPNYKDPLAIAFVGDPGKELQRLFVRELLRRCTGDDAKAMSAAELEVVRKVIESNAIDLNSIRRGEHGALAQEVARKFPQLEGDDLPFNADGSPRVN